MDLFASGFVPDYTALGCLSQRQRAYKRGFTDILVTCLYFHKASIIALI